jgi:GSH-dependent disulfide-bond oxidoreductase
MIDLYYWTTPNGHKITLYLEEAQLEYRIIPIDIGKGEQFRPEFLKVSPNNRIPAIVDQAPSDGGAPIAIFESGAILLYLAEKTGRFLPRDLRARMDITQWLIWQVANLGPMAGQNHHFGLYAQEKIPYAIERYVRETNRLYGVLECRLRERAFLGGEEYSIADMATYPWVVPWKRQQQQLDDFPNVRRWFESIRYRPATLKAYELAAQYSSNHPMSEASRKVLFGQTAEVFKAR